jgi:hypothetical protein
MRRSDFCCYLLLVLAMVMVLWSCIVAGNIKYIPFYINKAMKILYQYMYVYDRIRRVKKKDKAVNVFNQSAAWRLV